MHVFGDLVVFLDETKAAAVAPQGSAWTSWPAPSTAATPASSPAPPSSWPTCCTSGTSAGLSGFRLRPAALPHDLTQITERLVPELRRRGLFRARYEADTLRGLLGLARPANRYARLPTDGTGKDT